MNINIVYEDNHLLVVEKPPNVLSQGDITGDDDMLSILKKDIKQRCGKPGNVYLGLVHRLDRPVGGVMVFAKTSKAASRLSEQIRKGEFKKAYMAVAEGSIPGKNGRLEHYLEKDSRTNTVRVVNGSVAGSKKAVLDYTVLKVRDGLVLLKINLHTGRPHQIRVQLAASGAPLYGDRKYGTISDEKDTQIALWSCSIRLMHPTLKETVGFESKPPDIYPWSLFIGIY